MKPSHTPSQPPEECFKKKKQKQKSSQASCITWKNKKTRRKTSLSAYHTSIHNMPNMLVNRLLAIDVVVWTHTFFRIHTQTAYPDHTPT